jgi:hypothetical protein
VAIDLNAPTQRLGFWLSIHHANVSADAKMRKRISNGTNMVLRR